MADLSQVKARIAQQDIPTRNRDSIIEDRHNTEAPQRQIFADMRNASRGDNGAGQLMEALGLVNKAAGSFQDAANSKYAKREEDLGSQGLFDEAAGHSDPELIRKSNAYRSSVMTQRAQTSFYQNAEKLDDNIKSIVNSDDPKLLDPAVRAAAIEHAIDSNFKEFAFDPETGKLRDWGSPTAAKWLGQQMGAARAEVRAKALQMVEDRSNELSIQQAADAFGASVDAGKPMGFEDAMRNLLPTADKRKAKEQLILVSKDKAASLAEKAAELDDTDPEQAKQLRVQALSLIDGIRGSKRLDAPADTSKPHEIGKTPDGTPVVTAQAPASVPVEKHYAALEYIESRGKQQAVSPKGAVGVMQVMIGTGPEAAKLAGLPWDPQRLKTDADYNRKLGRAYYRKQLADFGDPIKAAAAYNAGPGRVSSAIAKYGDQWQAHIPGETKAYVKNFAERLGLDASKAYPSGPAVDPSVIDPQSPSELAAADPTGANNPLYSLSAAERADMGAFRRQLKSDIDKADEAATNKRQSSMAMDYMARLHGMGAYPTPGEIQSAARKGEIGVAHAVQLLGVIEQDENRRESDAREVRAEARADKAQAREDRVQIVDNHVNSILGKLVSGKYGAQGANAAEAELRNILPTIADSDVRQAVFAGVTQGIKAHVDLQKATPEYRKGMSSFDEWEAVYTTQLKGRRIAPEDRGRAEVLIKQWVDAYRVRLGEYAGLPPEKVQSYMDRAERDLDSMIDRRFPPRGGAVASANTSNGTHTMR